jgi:hypothetical protein
MEQLSAHGFELVITWLNFLTEEQKGIAIILILSALYVAVRLISGAPNKIDKDFKNFNKKI